MRPPRIIIVVAFFVTTVFFTFLSLRASHPPHTITTSSSSSPKTGIQAFFSFHAPFSLFPPNAVITLTHDNTTAFMARPAAFGPLLPFEGLKGQVWIGSGFGDDGIRQGGASAEGELGCSDMPDWVDSYAKFNPATQDGGKSGESKSAQFGSRLKIPRGSIAEDGPYVDRTAEVEPISRKYDGSEPSINDGTDDYLHYPLPESTVSKPTDNQPTVSEGNHADIQSLQEGAEIAGKVVLLSRGGCGFLEKVKWAQRRGGIALIVGDDTKGGPLIQMYARGDTSNVTIPAVFTSRTTAHLLSSLISEGSFIMDTLDSNGKTVLKVKKKAKKKQKSSPTFTHSTTAAKAAMTAHTVSRVSTKKASTRTDEKPSAMTTERPSWFKSLFFGSNRRNSKSDSSRPPSSGQLDWVLVDDWRDEDEAGAKRTSAYKASRKSDTEKKTQLPNKADSKQASGDDFVIGVQDWRDPDLVGQSETKDDENEGVTAVMKASDASKAKDTTPQPTKAGKKHTGGALQEIPEYIPPLRGGSITPGSGEYSAKISPAEDKSKANEDWKNSAAAGSKSKGILTTIFGDDEEDVGIPPSRSSSSKSYRVGDELSGEDGGDDEYEGLWVTLTPASGASPFLDTLLVLVVSPLVTLTIVYALLLIRSRIRRRRWRAPKSVVERLPVRTYQTVATPGNQSPRLPSPTSSSPNTPLLQQSPPLRPRPRSRTTTGIPEPGDLIRVNSTPLQVPTLPSQSRGIEHEKTGSVQSEWKKFMGKQVECVVCLEEYIDGVSRVMSLPCGHEFHVDCITPWLTTRRRTCPICKGDVVRSLARGSPSSPRYEQYHDDSDEDMENQRTETTALPILGAQDEDNDGDLEQGIVSSIPTRNRRAAGSGGSWRSVLASSLGSSSRSPRPPQEDRTR